MARASTSTRQHETPKKMDAASGAAPSPRELAAQLHAFRLEEDLSLENLAQQAGLSISTVSRICEAGSTGADVEIFERTAHKLWRFLEARSNGRTGGRHAG